MITRTYGGALWHGQTIPRGTEKKAKPEAKRGRPSTIMSDEKALECLARHDFFGWGEQTLTKHYGVSLRYMRMLLSGQVRIHLISKPEHANLPIN